MIINVVSQITYKTPGSTRISSFFKKSLKTLAKQQKPSLLAARVLKLICILCIKPSLITPLNTQWSFQTPYVVQNEFISFQKWVKNHLSRKPTSIFFIMGFSFPTPK